MKLVIALCLVAAATARPDRDATVVDQEYELRADQSYDLSYETSDGTIRDESGISYPGAEPGSGNYVQSGGYTFTHPDGSVSSITFIADENGYQPLGDVIPVFTGRVDIQDA
ncbi:cuticle protein CP14.6-like [Pollicipes pollicipes]|uniref:cuticle protein CP14.6-like n=1 Tax=Pollicipes pollicipes TaxID=41117 RepID=UPI0018851E37|nr:cuticle protein CP14.6-like [Pollicipes pollicipes]